MPGPCSAPLGYRHEGKGKTPRTGKTDVAKRGMPRAAHSAELERIRVAAVKAAAAAED